MNKETIQTLAQAFALTEAGDILAAYVRFGNNAKQIRRWAIRYFDDRREHIQQIVGELGMPTRPARNYAHHHCTTGLVGIVMAVELGTDLVDVVNNWLDEGPTEFAKTIGELVRTKRKPNKRTVQTPNNLPKKEARNKRVGDHKSLV